MWSACELSPLEEVCSPARGPPLCMDLEIEGCVAPMALMWEERSFILVHSFVNSSDSCRARR